MERPRFDAVRMTRLRRASEVEVSPCHTWMAVTVQRLADDESRYVSDLWRVSIDDPDAPPVQLTFGDAKDGSPRFRRDGALAFLSNRSAPGVDPAEGDKERMQVWVMPAAGGEPVRVTDEPLGVSDFRFAADAARLVVLADVWPGVAHDEQRAHAAEQAKHGPSGLRYTTMPIRHWDQWRPVAAPHVIAYAEDGSDRRDLTPEADFEFRPAADADTQWDLSRDGSRVAIVALRRGPDRLEDSSVRVIDVGTGQARDLGEVNRTEHMAPLWSPDGARICAARVPRPDRRPGKVDLWIYDAASGEGRAIATDWDVWPSPAAWTADGAAVLATADDRGAVPVFRIDVGTGEVARITREQAWGSHGQIDVAGDWVVGLRHRLHHPPEPFRVALTPDSDPLLLGRLSGFDESEGREIARWDSLEVEGDGGEPVQWFLLVPPGSEPKPAIMWIHGGPMGAFSDGWHWRWNPLVCADAGYVMAMPNPRGSTGFGQPFVNGIWNNTWGAACYRDIMAVADAMAARPEIDGAHIGAMGGSFGGYMTNWIGSQTDRFQCLMTHAGLYDLGSFYGTTDYPAYCYWENNMSPYDDPEEYDKYSPHRYAKQWKTPTLVIHGERDFRVPISEALMLFEALQLFEVDSELLIFPDENHWILKPRNARQWYQALLDFAAKHLKANEQRAG